MNKKTFTIRPGIQKAIHHYPSFGYIRGTDGSIDSSGNGKNY